MKETNTTASATAPSNIAIVKYWGKKDEQLPVNPSISFTLSKSVTQTDISYQTTNTALEILFLLDGNEKPEFIPKIRAYIQRIKHLLPALETGILTINSSNTFPHSSGIASSASSMAALSMALFDALATSDVNKEPTLSEMARLGSGSACRSTSLGWNLWGRTEQMPLSTDQYAISLNERISPVFQTLQDTILILNSSKKTVSSTVGHQLMENHPYREGRIQQANANTEKLLNILKTDDFNAFAEICEEEALSLHALMMSSKPGYTLLEPVTLQAIERLKAFRAENKLPLTFTLDAGPNLHIIYPQAHSKAIMTFIMIYLRPFCEDNQLIKDEISFNTINK